MRRFLFGAAIASFTTFMPAWAIGGDREIAKAVMTELQHHKAAGSLKGFDIDLKVEDGVVYLNGKVASGKQRNLVAQAAANEVGSTNLVNNLKVVAPTASSTKGLSPKVTISKQSLPKPVAPELSVPKRIVPKPVAAEQTAPSRVAPRQAAPKRIAPKPIATKQPAPAQPAVRQAAARPDGNRPAPSDVAVTDRVIGTLQQYKASGRLRGFELDVSTVKGDLWLRGKVGMQSHKDLILNAARRTPGVTRVIDDITVTAASRIQPASTGEYSAPVAVQPRPIPVSGPAPVPQGSSMPVVGQPVPMTPQAFAPSGLASMQGGAVPGGRPVAMQGAGVQYGAGAPRYDQPNMPSYAWPSYAAYPNYGAVTYPQQYSPSAWPYIGPFHPYPQVPLGWRKVSLEWDDGLWYLDFTSK